MRVPFYGGIIKFQVTNMGVSQNQISRDRKIPLPLYKNARSIFPKFLVPPPVVIGRSLKSTSSHCHEEIHESLSDEDQQVNENSKFDQNNLSIEASVDHHMYENQDFYILFWECIDHDDI